MKIDKLWFRREGCSKTILIKYKEWEKYKTETKAD
jgi:hypothetical protein